MAIHDDLAVLLAKKNMTQSELADAMGVSKQAVSSWISGRTSPTGTNLIKLRIALGLPPNGVGLSDSGLASIPSSSDLKTNYVINSTDEVEDGWTRVPVFDVDASCGGGGLNANNMITGTVDFNTAFLRSLQGVLSPSGIEIVHSVGDSMSPTISSHALVLVDRHQQRISVDGIFCLMAQDQVFIKRVLRNIDGSISLISDNPKYPPQLVEKELLNSFTIIGRVVYVLNGEYI